MELAKLKKLIKILDDYHVDILEEYNINWYMEDIFKELIECALNRKVDVVIEEISDGKYYIHAFLNDNEIKTIYVKSNDTKDEILEKIMRLM